MVETVKESFLQHNVVEVVFLMEDLLLYHFHCIVCTLTLSTLFLLNQEYSSKRAFTKETNHTYGFKINLFTKSFHSIYPTCVDDFIVESNPLLEVQVLHLVLITALSRAG